MNRDERDSLRASVAWLRPKMHVELPVVVLLELLATCDALELERDELLLASMHEAGGYDGDDR